MFGRMFLWLFVLFLLPALGSLAWWMSVKRPESWRCANWSSAQILPTAADDAPAAVYVLCARTGGLKGALSQHCWIVLKRENASSYDRYDKVGWGRPVRKNAYAADANWYSNTPNIIKAIKGTTAQELIRRIEDAITAYPYGANGDYRLWPGPNSNSFVAHVLRQVPELELVLPPNAVGRDFIGTGKFWHADTDHLDFKLGINGLAGISIGARSGFELNFLGLVTGIDIQHPAVKLPGFGRIGVEY